MTSWNPGEVKDTQGHVPDGEYMVQCNKVEHLRNKKTGLVITEKTLEFDFVVLGGPSAKRHIYTTVSIDPERWAQYPSAEVVMAKLVLASGHQGAVSLEQDERLWQEKFHNRVFKLKVATKDDRNGYPRTHIQAVRTLSEEETAIKQALEFDVLARDTERHEAAESDDQAIPF